jgi:SpoVK/Ycf46/Vps4 family AAA+-type ATPase
MVFVERAGADIENLCRESAIQACREYMEEFELKALARPPLMQSPLMPNESSIPHVTQRHFESVIAHARKSKVEHVAHGFDNARIKHL